MMSLRFLSLLAVAGWFSANSAWPQDYGVYRFDSRFAETSESIEKAIKNWEIVPGVRTSNEAFSKLEENGWNTNLLDVPATDELQLFKRAVAPGVNNFLIVPRGSNPVELSPVIDDKTPQIHQAFWGRKVTSERIKDEIINGMNAAIDALCDMRARPSMIRAKASAFGVVEVEATWNNENICEQI